MKLNPCAFSNESNDGSIGRRKKEDAGRIDTAIKTALDELGDHEERRAAFVDLLAGMRSRTALLKPTPGRGTPGWVAPVFLINRLKNLAARQSHWIRSCETWRPEADNLRTIFRSLAYHLLAHYPVPGFMDSVWDLAAGRRPFAINRGAFASDADRVSVP